MSSKTQAPQVFRLSTDQMSVRDRLPFWREQLGQSLLRLDVDAYAAEGFAIDFRGMMLGSMFAGKIKGAASIERRTKALLADGNDTIAFVMNQRSPFIIAGRGRTMELGNGDAIAMSFAEQSAFIRPSSGQALGLNLPRAALIDQIPDLDDRLAMPIPAQSEPLRLLGSYLSLLDDPTAITTPSLQQAVVLHVCDLLALALGCSREKAFEAQRGGGAAARLHAIKRDVLRRLADPALSVAAIARRHGIGPRQIQRLFEAEGMTLTQFVLDARLDRAHLALRTAAGPLNVTGVAFESGFSDLSYFSRAFRRRFGLSPSEFFMDRRADP